MRLLTKKELQLLEKVSKEYGFVSKSETVRSAVRLYLNLLTLALKIDSECYKSSTN